MTRGLGGVTAALQCEAKIKVASSPVSTEDLNVCQLRLPQQGGRVWFRGNAAMFRASVDTGG
jgi:hypothetical protein